MFRQGRKVFLLFALVSIFWSINAIAQQKKEPNIVRLKLGAQKILTVEKLAKLAIGDSEVATATLVGANELLLTGIKPGFSTSLTIWLEDGSVKTFDIIVHTIGFEEVVGMVKHLPGVTVEEAGTKIVLHGEVVSAEENQTCEAIAKRFPEVVNLVTLTKMPARVTVKPQEIKKQIGIEAVDVKLINNVILLSGSVCSQVEYEQAEQIANIYGPQVINTIKIEPKQVEIDVIYASVNIARAHDYGGNLLAALNLDTAIGRRSDNRASKNGGTGSTTGSAIGNTVGSSSDSLLGYSGNHATIAADALATLSFLKSKGAASILAKPHLSVISGEEAKLLNGGERGFESISTTGASNITFKEFGLIMKIKPEFERNNKVQLNISLEISLPISAAGTSGEMAFTKFQTQSRVSCEMGKTIVLAGLLQAFKNDSRVKTPLLGDIPLLGYFFKKKIKEVEDLRLVVLLTPQDPTIFKSQIKARSLEYNTVLETAEKSVQPQTKKTESKKTKSNSSRKINFGNSRRQGE